MNDINKSKSYNKLTENDKINIINCYYDKNNIHKTFKEMYTFLNVSERAFSRVLKENGINTKRINRYTIKNEDYFENINTELKAYFLGFIYADGAIGTNNDIILNLKFSNYNIKLINKFINEIGYSGNYNIKKGHNPLSKENAIRLNFSCEKMWNDLNRLGIIPNKSLELKILPCINNSLYCHFIRGYFDGDGSICVYYDNYDQRERYSLSILGTYDFLTDLQNKLYDLCLIKPIKLHKTKSYNTKELNHRGKKNIIKIREFLYKYATFYIDYKRDKLFSIT